MKFTLPENARPGIMLSGGADSTLVLWLLLKNKIKPKAFVVDRKNGSVESSRRVIDWINQYFNIKYKYPTIVGDPTLPHDQQVGSGLKEIRSRRLATHIFLGTTQNPPITLPGNPPVRPTSIRTRAYIAPFLLSNKQDIYQIYKENNILELFDLTQSCEIYQDKHCGECFSCHERKWSMDV
jgi:7-cyano-7-deazaguanine synthase in queuosine biosynthesis